MMRKAVVAALLLLIPGTLFAQGGRRGGGRGGGGRGATAAMVNVAKVLVDAKDQLALNADQLTKITAIQAQIDSVNKPHVDAISQMLEAMRGGGGRGDPSQFEQLSTHATAARTTNDEAYANQIKPLLTAEQVPRADSLIAAARPAGRGRRGGGGGGF